MLLLLKMSVLGLSVVLVGIVSLWLSNVGERWWYVPIVAMLGAVGVLSSLFLGDENAAFRQAANAAWGYFFRSPAYAGTTAAILLVVVVASGWQAWRTWPGDPNYFSVMVFRQLRQPAHFAVGARVVLHTHTDGATHTELVGENGFARFRDIPQKTTAVLQINELRDSGEWTWGAAPLTIKELPDQTEYDLATVPDDDWAQISRVVEPMFSPTGVPSPPIGFGPEQREIGDRSLQSLNAPWGVPSAPTIIYRYAYVLGFDVERRIPPLVGVRNNSKPERRWPAAPFRP